MSDCILAMGLAFAASAASAQNSGFKLVANTSVTVSSVTASDASRYFLKKKATWPDGQKVRVVDQREGASARAAFSKTVLKKDVSGVKSYWQTQISSGRASPPVEKTSDAAVVAYVAPRYPGCDRLCLAGSCGRQRRQESQG